MALCSESARFLSSASLCLTLLWALPIDVCVLYGLHFQCLQRIFIIISDDTFTSDVFMWISNRDHEYYSNEYQGKTELRYVVI
jgi:hypothetical protein